MKLNWYVIGIVVLFAIFLIVFLVRRNLKDEKELEVFLDKNEFSIEEEEELDNSL